MFETVGLAPKSKFLTAHVEPNRPVTYSMLEDGTINIFAFTIDFISH